MRLEYARAPLQRRRRSACDAYLAPTQKLQPGPGLRYAVSFDDEAPQVVNVHADGSLAAWEKTVADGVTVLRSKHVIAAPGPHVLKFWAIDPALVLQKLVVDTGGCARATSARRRASIAWPRRLRPGRGPVRDERARFFPPETTGPWMS